MITVAAPQPVPGVLREESPFLPTPRQFFLILLANFSLLLVLRTLLSETAGIDEADQLVVGQKFSWGYGPHAPLYTWLMMLFLRVFGPSEFSLTLLRELVLFGVYALTYCNARLITRSHACGVVAAIALQFHPTIVWEAQRELTHSLVASLMLLALLFTFLRLEPGRWSSWLAFGLCGGLSILSKYNAALFFAGLMLSALSLPGLRSRVLNPRMAVTCGLSVLVALPNLWWVSHHRGEAFGLVWKFGIQRSVPWVETVCLGLLAWVETAAAHLAPLLLIFAAIFWRPIFVQRALRLPTDEAKLLWRTFLGIIVMVVLSVLFFRVTQFKDRWLQPIFVSVPILLVVVLRDYLDRTRLNRLLLLGGVVTIIVTPLTSARLLLTEWRNRRDVLNAPFRQLAADLADSARDADFIVSGHYWLGGNLRLWFPHKPVFSPDLASPSVGAGRSCLVIWAAPKNNDPPAELAEFARAFTGKNTLDAPRYVERIWKYHHSKTMKLGFWVLTRSGSPG